MQSAPTQSRQSSEREVLAELEKDGNLNGLSEDVEVDVSWVALRGHVGNQKGKCEGRARISER